MAENNRVTRNIVIGISVLFFLLILIDRYYWAQISQWREDQATNIWLGYTAKLTKIPPVGLISTKGIPNPNGMVLLGAFLSIQPRLISISFFLGVAEILLLVLVAWKACGRNWRYFLLIALPSITSVILRSSSVEYWNQYVIIFLNIFFIFLALRYLEAPSLWNIPPIVILILWAPALYLAGIVNAIVMLVITFGILLYKKPNTKNIFPVTILTLGIVLLSIFVTWKPYFEIVGVGQLKEVNKDVLGTVALFRIVWQTIFGIPSYVPFQWTDNIVFSEAIKHADKRILSYVSQRGLSIVGVAYLLQAVFAFLAFSYASLQTLVKAVRQRGFSSTANLPALNLVILSFLFIGLSFAISPWMGGANWMNGERPDQTVQFLPMFFYLIFLLPFVVTTSSLSQKIINWLAVSIFSFFIISNLICGCTIIRDHLQYQGTALTEADVPLVDKMDAVDFIANDWKKHSNSNIIAVDYDLTGEKWYWIPEFGTRLLPWYSAPMTIGRGFDYEFLRRHGLTNQQEGIQLRTFGNGRYLITYECEDPPQIENRQITHHDFGRLRVSIVEE